MRLDIFYAFISIPNSDWSFLTQPPLNKMRAECHDNGGGISFTQKPSHLSAASHTHFLSIRASQELLFPSANANIVTCDVLQTHPMVLSACSRSSVCRIFCGGVKAPLKWDKNRATELTQCLNYCISSLFLSVILRIFPLSLRRNSSSAPRSDAPHLQRNINTIQLLDCISDPGEKCVWMRRADDTDSPGHNDPNL